MATRKPAVNSKVSLTKRQVQSRCFTMSKRDFNGAEEDIVMKIVEYAQAQIKGLKSDDFNGLKMNTWGDVIIPLNVAELSKDRTERARYRQACRHLVTKLIEVDKGIDENGADNWIMIPFFQMAEKKGDIISVQVSRYIWNSILDFTKKSFDMYSMEVALSLQSQYAKRIYMIISQSEKAIPYSLESLNRAFGTDYKAKNFERKVLDQAKKELDAKADWSIDYKPYYPTSKQWAEMKANGAKGRMPILGWTLIPVRIHNVEVDEADIDERVRQGRFLRTPADVQKWLIGNIGFDKDWLRRDDKILAEAVKTLGGRWEYEFGKIKAAMARYQASIDCPPKYFLQCLKKLIEDNGNSQNCDIEKAIADITKAFDAK